MIKLENFEVMGWEHAIRGMRNPMNSWDRSDSFLCKEVGAMTHKELEESCGTCPKGDCCDIYDAKPHYIVGENDHELMMKLANGGPVHAKYRRMIVVYVDITAPLYWWKEFDTYKVGTVANSCSTMHKIHEKEFTFDDFSSERLLCTDGPVDGYVWDKYTPLGTLCETIATLNECRNQFLKTKDKRYWDSMIQLLPSSYNQKRTIMLNYEVLAGIYPMRKNHKLDEWRTFCEWIEKLPYSELITQSRADTSFQEDLEFFVNDCTKAQLETLYKRIEEKLKEENTNAN